MAANPNDPTGAIVGVSEIGIGIATGNPMSIVTGGLMVADFIYHRWLGYPTPPPPAQQLSFPRTDTGAPYPLLYGQCRVKAPVLAWNGTPIPQFVNAGDNLGNGIITATTDTYYYFMDMLFTIGIPFDGDGIYRLLNVFLGETLLTPLPGASQAEFPGVGYLNGDGNFETPGGVNLDIGAAGYAPNVFGNVEFLNGNDAQQLVDPTSPWNPTTYAGRYMTTTTSGHPIWDNLTGITPGAQVPGYRGFLSAFLFCNLQEIGGGSDWLRHWLLGTTPDVPSYGFEVATFPGVNTCLGPSYATGDITNPTGVNDANPIDVIYDLLTGRMKCGIDPSRIDAAPQVSGLVTSFGTAAQTLWEENHGFSRSWEGGASASSMIQEILRQIDGAMYEDQATGLIKIKLIRNDYDPQTIFQITRSNCYRLENLAASGFTNIPSRVRIAFSNRGDNYRDGAGTAQNTPTAAVQDGNMPELQISMPGITEQDLADNIAGRELAANCRPLIKLRAICDRSTLALNPGDPVRLYWTDPDISGLVFRVASPNRGTLKDGKVAIDLIQDYFYIYRSRTPVIVAGPGFPGPPRGGIKA